MPKEIPLCELCGRKPSIYNCEIEGTMMKVCDECSRFGGVKGKSNVKIVVQESKKMGYSVPSEPDYTFVNGYGLIVKNAREKQDLKQEDFAKKINEHKSLIHQVESEHIKPSIQLARKLEKALHIKIVDEIRSEKFEPDEDSKVLNSTGRLAVKPKSEGMSLGDFIKRR